MGRILCTMSVRYGFEPAWDDPSSEEFAPPCRCGALEVCNGCGKPHVLVERCSFCAALGQMSIFERTGT